MSNLNGNSSLNGNTISRFAGTGPGTFSTTFTTFATGFNQPQGLAFDAQGDLFAATAGSITEFASTGAGIFGAGTTFATNLNTPDGLAFDSKGDLFAANLSDGSITEFASTGAGTFAAGTTFARGSTARSGLAFGAQGNLFAADLSGAIAEYAYNPVAGTFGTRTDVANDPYGAGGLAFDTKGNLYVTSPNAGGGITEFASTGAGTFATGSQFGASGGAGASFLAFGPLTPGAVPEASTTVSLGLLLALGMGGLVAARKRRKA